MHEMLNSFKQKPIPKFQQKLINFEKPQNLVSKHEMHVNERKETYQVKRKTWKSLKNTWEWGLEWERVF